MRGRGGKPGGFIGGRAFYDREEPDSHGGPREVVTEKEKFEARIRNLAERSFDVANELREVLGRPRFERPRSTDAAIERCADVAEDVGPSDGDIIAAALRELKGKP